MPASRIALFGGTFDPIHEGHLCLMEKAREEFGFDHVLVIPCARSPFKDASAIASAGQRCRMIELAIAERGISAWAELSRFEVDRPPPSYTWRTASHYAGAFPGAELTWILGADQWKTIEDWADSERLRRLLHFVVVTREDCSVPARPGWQHRILEFVHPASATAIRAGNGDPRWLPDSVRAYCEENHLYSFSRSL